MDPILGKYANMAGAEIEVTRRVPGWIGSTQVIGALYEAVQQNEIFGKRILLVTRDGLTDANYTKEASK